LGEATHGTNVDDVARPLGAQVRQNGAHDVQDAEDVRREDGLDLLGRGFLDGAQQPMAGIVDDIVDAPKPARAASTATRA